MLVIQGVLCGYIVSLSTLQPFLVWPVYINPLFYTMETMFKNEFFRSNPALWALDIDQLADTYGYTASGIGETFLYLVATIAVHKAISFLSMKFVRFSLV